MKFILASLAVSCAFTATAFAAELSTDYNYTYSIEVTPATVNAGDTVEVAVFMSATDTSGNPIDAISIPDDNDATVGVGLNFNPDVVSIAVSRDTVSTDTYLANMFRKTKVNGTNNITMFYDGTYGIDIGEIAPDTALVKYTFTVLDSATTATYDSSNPLFELLAATTETADTLGNKVTTNKTMAACPTVNVKGTAPAGPTATQVGTTSAKGVTEYAISTGEQVMMSQKFTNQTITEATRVLITYNGETRPFGSDLYAKLGGTTNGGEIEIGSLTFGLIVSGDATADQFEFAIE